MNYKMLQKRINYDGSQLRSHFVFEAGGILGDGAIGFIGACDV
ncbi:MAG: DUF366 family protein, partial [Deltaproteobacteria bacterium]|nr:DUF366 family protein [Deltaproteobacteria bacterium]